MHKKALAAVAFDSNGQPYAKSGEDMLIPGRGKKPRGSSIFRHGKVPGESKLARRIRRRNAR